jgi:hypothetical protein
MPGHAGGPPRRLVSRLITPCGGPGLFFTFVLKLRIGVSLSSDTGVRRRTSGEAPLPGGLPRCTRAPPDCEGSASLEQRSVLSPPPWRGTRSYA